MADNGTQWVPFFYEFFYFAMFFKKFLCNMMMTIFSISYRNTNFG